MTKSSKVSFKFPCVVCADSYQFGVAGEDNERDPKAWKLSIKSGADWKLVHVGKADTKQDKPAPGKFRYGPVMKISKSGMPAAPAKCTDQKAAGKLCAKSWLWEATAKHGVT